MLAPFGPATKWWRNPRNWQGFGRFERRATPSVQSAGLGCYRDAMGQYITLGGRASRARARCVLFVARLRRSCVATALYLQVWMSLVLTSDVESSYLLECDIGLVILLQNAVYAD